MSNLEKLIELTHEVQSLVEAGEWIEAAKLEKSRRPLVEAFLDARPRGDELARAGDVFEKVVAIDTRMLARIREQRGDALLELQRETGSGRAAQAYLSNSVCLPDQ